MNAILDVLHRQFYPSVISDLISLPRSLWLREKENYNEATFKTVLTATRVALTAAVVFCLLPNLSGFSTLATLTAIAYPSNAVSLLAGSFLVAQIGLASLKTAFAVSSFVSLLEGILLIQGAVLIANEVVTSRYSRYGFADEFLCKKLDRLLPL